MEGLGRRAREERRAPNSQHPQPLPSGSSTGRVMTGSLAMDVTSAPPETLHLLPVDKVLILITLHLILNGGLQVPNALECQLEVSLQALVSGF